MSNRAVPPLPLATDLGLLGSGQEHPTTPVATPTTDEKVLLPPSMTVRLGRLLAQHPLAQDIIGSYLDGLGNTGQYALVLLEVVLVKPPSAEQRG